MNMHCKRCQCICAEVHRILLNNCMGCSFSKRPQLSPSDLCCSLHRQSRLQPVTVLLLLTESFLWLDCNMMMVVYGFARSFRYVVYLIILWIIVPPLDCSNS